MAAAQLVLAAITAVAPEGATPDELVSTIDRTEATGSETEFQLVAYDRAGAVVGVVALWAEPDGRMTLSLDFPDGYVETVVVDGRARTTGSLPLAVVEARSDAI